MSTVQVHKLASATKVPVQEAKALHPAFYINDQYSKVEREQIFGKHWFAVAHTAELAKPGDVKVVDVGSNSFILTRDKSGKLNAFHNACRHRGARVCSKSQSGCKQLVCPYHWWAYRLDGSLKSTPPAATGKEKKETLSLVRVPGVETFAGLIFLNRNPDPVPFADILGDLPEKLKRYDLDSLELHGIQNYNIHGDWKLLAENFIDFYHVNAVHPALAKFSKVVDHHPYQGNGQYVGFVTAPLTDSGGPGDSDRFNSFPRLRNTEKNAALFFHIFPNVSLTVYPHSMYTLIMLPTEEGSKTQEQLTVLMAPGARKEQDSDEQYKHKCQELMDFVVNVNDEDVVAVENLQRGLVTSQSSNVQGEFLPEYDWSIHRFQNMVISGMQGENIDPLILPTLSSHFEDKLQAESFELAQAIDQRAPFDEQIEAVESCLIPELTSGLEEQIQAEAFAQGELIDLPVMPELVTHFEQDISPASQGRTDNVSAAQPFAMGEHLYTV
jgi:choline monooxygenase